MFAFFSTELRTLIQENKNLRQAPLGGIMRQKVEMSCALFQSVGELTFSFRVSLLKGFCLPKYMDLLSNCTS